MRYCARRPLSILLILASSCVSLRKCGGQAAVWSSRSLIQAWCGTATRCGSAKFNAKQHADIIHHGFDDYVTALEDAGLKIARVLEIPISERIRDFLTERINSWLGENRFSWCVPKDRFRKKAQPSG